MSLKKSRAPHSLPVLLGVFLIILLIFLFIKKSVYAAVTLPSGFTQTRITGGLSKPTAFEIAPDGRIFVTQQTGELRVIKNGTLLASSFLTVTTEITGERGLLGIAIDHDFATNKYLYVYYTVPGTGGAASHNRVSRFTANGDVAVDGSELPILELNDLSDATNHNGGPIHFGPDHKLYVGVGENGNPANAQTLNTRLGKMLRINSDGSIPNDNPFNSTATGDNQAIWAMGLRNPFTFAFQPGTGRMFINDVGQNTWEEIDDGIAGSNYGWNICEGFCNPPNASYRDPLFEYPHGNGTSSGCAIVGGAFYNPTTVQFPPDYVGDYFFDDLCNGWIRRFDPSDSSVQVFATGIPAAVDLRVLSDGSLLYLARNSGEVWQVKYNPSATKTPTRTATRTATRTSTTTTTRTPTRTVTRTATPTRTATHVNTATPTRTNTPTITFTRTATRTPTVSRTPTHTRTPTFTPDGPWIFCAKANNFCAFSGTRQVRYGANGKYNSKVFSNGVQCNSTNFGDPAVGIPKMCHYNVATVTPTP